MSEKQSGRQSVDPVPAGSRNSDSQLRLVRGDEEVVIPDNAEPTDDSPTIISKKAIAEAVQPSGPHLDSLAGSNLRGQRLAHFELLEPIGVGGMAAVIRARDTKLDRFVALKILPPEMAADPENVRRFHQEARAAAKLDHENIARVFFCGEDKRLHFIAFEFVEGANLRTLLERRRQQPVGESVRYVLQIAAGLEHASSRGVVHRDIKPSNIIISSNGRAKLVDMGLARSQEPHGDKALTQSGVTLGTFDYISPEQALEPREADTRSDIYSLGCTFYHMLTGQPPVPDGTAAKKLHHHREVPPIDPRQLNPNIPDEVAAILMRMMAKDPRERYQRPVYLIQHLMQVAEKVGAGAVAEGVMFLDAPLPAAPRLNPLLTVSVAALALGILLLLVSLAPLSKNPLGQVENIPARIVKEGDKSAPQDHVPNSKPDVIPPKSAAVATREKLKQVLEDKQRADGPIILDANIDLGQTGLRIQGEKVIIQSHEDGEQTIRFQQPARMLKEGYVAGLTVDGATVEFHKVRFELSGKAAAGSPVALIAALASASGPTKVKFVGCTFTQKDVPASRLIDARKTQVPRASVLAFNPSNESTQKPEVIFERCYWEQGQAAVALHGAAKVTAKQCAFGPHAALFHLRGTDAASELNLSRCSTFVVQGPAFRLDDNHICQLKVDYSIFSCPETGGADNHDEIQFIRQTDAIEPLVKFEGQRNCYHNLNAFWVGSSETDIVGFTKGTFDQFKAYVKDTGGKDLTSSVVTVSPWAAADPLNKTLLPVQAFQLRADVPAEVRTTTDLSALGVLTCAFGNMQPVSRMTPTPAQLAELKPHEKVIDPDGPDNPPMFFKSLAKAHPYTVPGDVLLFKHGRRSRDIKISSLNLKPPLNCELTLKPYPGHQPVLVLAEDSLPDVALFRLYEGKLLFENLEFVLDPGPDQKEQSQSIIALAGSGVVSFKNCAFTLRQPDRPSDRRLSVVTFLDEKLMKPATMPAQPLAQIRLEDSLLRGDGDLINVRGSRPFRLELDNALLALGGSILVLQGGSSDAAMEMATIVKMSKVTAFCGESAIFLRGGKSQRPLPLINFDARGCLFTLGAKPLITLDNLEASEETLKQFLKWEGKDNAYAHFDPMRSTMLELYRPDLNLALTLDADAWRTMEEARFSQAKLPLPVLSRIDYLKLREELREEFAGFGAGLDPDILPRFTAPRKLDFADPDD